MLLKNIISNNILHKSYKLELGSDADPLYLENMNESCQKSTMYFLSNKLMINTDNCHQVSPRIWDTKTVWKTLSTTVMTLCYLKQQQLPNAVLPLTAALEMNDEFLSLHHPPTALKTQQKVTHLSLCTKTLKKVFVLKYI